MEQSEVTTDEQVRPFLIQWSKDHPKFTDSHMENMAVQETMNNYEFKRKTTTMSVQEALQFALTLAEKA